ncbi:MAG: ABC transporter ATP-binding protein [marine bacterium B5-7]|nr:MAG: ABC transporter ATP-binding protein [marine bacterium B5-7]
MSSLIELKNICRQYQQGDQIIPVLKSVDLTINDGDMLAIMGPSGAGKSTLMNILGLLDRPTSGEYYLLSKPVAQLSDDEKSHLRNQHIGFIFQQFNLLPRLSLLQNVCLPLGYRGMPEDEAEEKALKMLGVLGLSEHPHKKPSELSGGQQQRVAIARALAGDPPIILADEPTGALDSQTGQMIMDLLKQLSKEQKKTIIIITHDADIAAQCQRTIRINDGELREDA